MEDQIGSGWGIDSEDGLQSGLCRVIGQPGVGPRVDPPIK
jgi:hypothetical protein